MNALICGHPPSPHGEHTTGTAILPDGRTVCCECADAWQRDVMVSATNVMAYLSGDSTTLTSWAGGELATVTSIVKRRVAKRRPGSLFTPSGWRLYFKAVDATGKRWHGCSEGPCMLARMRATKTRQR